MLTTYHTKWTNNANITMFICLRQARPPAAKHSSDLDPGNQDLSQQLIYLNILFLFWRYIIEVWTCSFVVLVRRTSGLVSRPPVGGWSGPPVNNNKHSAFLEDSVSLFSLLPLSWKSVSHPPLALSAWDSQVSKEGRTRKTTPKTRKYP